MSQSNTLRNYFKKRDSQSVGASSSSLAPPSATQHMRTPSSAIPASVDISDGHQRPHKTIRIEDEAFNINSLERDPGLRHQISAYHLNLRDKVRCAYLKLGPYQPELEEKPGRQFQESWFKTFPWLEYSPTIDAAFCLLCFVSNPKVNDGRFGSQAFTVNGFRSWKKVNAGEDCAFLTHIGKNSKSAHNKASKACQDLMNHSQHIEKVLEKQSSEQKAKTRLRLAASINTARWLAFQACAFRGHDERPDSKNRGNFIEMLKLLASYNENIAETVLENAPKNAKYTSPDIQKELLSILARKVRDFIREEIGDSKFCIIVDEARDESKREQMAIVLRFVDKYGILRERFFDVVHVPDTTASTLKENISAVLSHHNLKITDIRGQGYDGAGNMRGEWNGLQALFLKDCPYAYYVHCFAHRLQLALLAATKEVKEVYEFFSQLYAVVNSIGASCKRNDEVQVAQAKHLTELLDIGEIESGRGLNQIGTLQRPADTRWGSHYTSICSLIKMFDATCQVVSHVIENGCTYSQRGDANIAYKVLASFEFVFILHLMQEIMGITNQLCQVLQQKSQDILNVVELIKSTKNLLHELRDDGWSTLLENVTLFCNQTNVDIPDMNSLYLFGSSKRYQKKKDITNEHYYRIDLFVKAIDSQREELNDRFNEYTMELFVLSSALDPRDGYRLLKVNDICDLVNKFYPQDFTNQEKIHLRYELKHYSKNVTQDSELKSLTTISELCQGLVKTGKIENYPLVYRLICLILTLPVSTATSERAFSAMKIVKSRLRNRMEDDFLADNMVIYIEKDIAEKFNTNSSIDDFRDSGPRREDF